MAPETTHVDVRSTWLNLMAQSPNSPVNSKRTHPLPGICHLVGPPRGEFVRKSVPGGGAFVNSSRSGYRPSFFSISHKNMSI